MHVRVRDADGRGAELLEQHVVPVDVAPRVHDQRLPVAHQHVAQRPLADAVELQHALKRRRGRQRPGHVHGFPGGHPAHDRVRLDAFVAEERRHLLAAVAVAADDGDRGGGSEAERVEGGELVKAGPRQGLEGKRGAEGDAAAGDFLRRADVEHLHLVAAVEAPRQLVGSDLWEVRHGE